MEALRVEKISKNFGGVWALSDVSFTANLGDKLALIGPNGAGKTTLLNVLNGQIFPSTGRIYFRGTDITSMPTHRRTHIGLARSFQLTTLCLRLTVLQNALLAVHGTKRSRFDFFRSFAGYPEEQKRARHLLETWDLWEKRNELTAEISYGDQRRMEIALSLASDPKILFLDEPSNGLTAEESATIVKMIYNLPPDVTVIVVAHDMDLVFSVANRIIVLYYGQLIGDGAPEEIQKDDKVCQIYMGIEDGTGNPAVN